MVTRIAADLQLFQTTSGVSNGRKHGIRAVLHYERLNPEAELSVTELFPARFKRSRKAKNRSRMNRFRIPPHSGRWRPNQSSRRTEPKRTFTGKETDSNESKGYSPDKDNYPRPRITANSRSKNLCQRSDFAELAAFLGLSVAGVVGILLAVILNRDFPGALDRVAERMSVQHSATESGSAAFKLNVPPNFTDMNCRLR